ncbi:MAG: GDP-mannose 4,6-dehydratase [Parcubacteria group bacterium Gr01-1014_66]|nr:MAG: GDP-mannose 4,6-dehydratase [Parcubacteria group bacterium Gr01-1014_66]
MPQKTALITGITGQDGSYLAELLWEKNYAVHGLLRRSSIAHKEKIAQVLLTNGKRKGVQANLTLHYGDLLEEGVMRRILAEIQPDEVYNLAAQSHVGVSFEVPVYTADVVATGTLRLLEAIRNACPRARFYQASSSEMFGNAKETPQNEFTPFHPASPYAVAKVAAFHFTRMYRDAYGLFACNGMLFNHESPRRGENFVTRKITSQVAEIIAGKREKIQLGNINAERDWGYAPEYVEAMWRMLQQSRPDDYVIATGETHSVREFAKEAFLHAGISDWEPYVEEDSAYKRPADVALLCGDATKAKIKLEWEPKVNFKELVRIMVDADLKRQGIARVHENQE